MSRKKHAEHVNHERWLVSYADFITLLFAFFVVLFASGQSDKKKQVQLAQAMQAAFTNNGVFEQHMKSPPLADTTNIPVAVTYHPSLPVPAKPSVSIAEQQAALQQKLQAIIAAQHLPPGSITVHQGSDGVVVSLHDGGFFASGSAEVSAASIPLLLQLAASLHGDGIRVEGHTDNVPIHSSLYATNWELSTARAAAIARFLLDRGAVKPESLSAAGYAEFHPVASNATEAGRAQNRRVDIILLEPGAPTQSPHL